MEACNHLWMWCLNYGFLYGKSNETASTTPNLEWHSIWWYQNKQSISTYKWIFFLFIMSNTFYLERWKLIRECQCILCLYVKARKKECFTEMKTHPSLFLSFTCCKAPLKQFLAPVRSPFFQYCSPNMFQPLTRPGSNFTARERHSSATALNSGAAFRHLPFCSRNSTSFLKRSVGIQKHKDAVGVNNILQIKDKIATASKYNIHLLSPPASSKSFLSPVQHRFVSSQPLPHCEFQSSCL